MPAIGDRSATFVPLHANEVNPIPFSEGNSTTCVFPNHSLLKGIPCSGDRSDTFVAWQSRLDKAIPCSGDKSDNLPLPESLPPQLRPFNPANARTGEISV